MNEIVNIITVTYNANAIVGKTIDSIIGQDYENKRLIIVDGGSADGTLEVLNKYRNCFYAYISEKDSGIYNAMNKGVRMADDGWILFMNAGDSFATNHSLSDLFLSRDIVEYDVVYGNAIYCYPWGKISKKAGEIQGLFDFDNGLPFCHQSSAVRKQWLLRYPFEESFRIVADFHFFRTIYEKGASFRYVDSVVAEYEVGGYSASSYVRLFKECQRVLGRDNGFKYRISLALVKVKSFLSGIIPEGVFSRVRMLKYKKSIYEDNIR